MRVLVTGGAGYVGSHACKALALAGHEPIVVDNLRTGHRWAVRWGPFEHCDICDIEGLSEIIRRWRPDAVMHFAAVAYVGESMERPDLYYRTNVGGTLTVLDACRHAGIERVIFSSSCATYGVPEVMPVSESSDQRPVNPYGQTKLIGEGMLRDYARAFGLGSVALRYFNAAGADPDGDIGEEHDPEPHLLPLILQTAAGLRPSIDIYGTDYSTPDGTCIRDYVHVSDLAVAHVAALGQCEPGSLKAFNLGAGTGASVREVIDAARQITGRGIEERVAERRPGDPPVLVADPTLAREELGWTPRHSDLKPILETTWAWMVDHRQRVGLPSRLTGATAR